MRVQLPWACSVVLLLQRAPGTHFPSLRRRRHQDVSEFHCDYLEDPELTNKTSGIIDSREAWSVRDCDYRIYPLLPLQEWRFIVV